MLPVPSEEGHPRLRPSASHQVWARSRTPSLVAQAPRLGNPQQHRATPSVNRARWVRSRIPSQRLAPDQLRAERRPTPLVSLHNLPEVLSVNRHKLQAVPLVNPPRPREVPLDREHRHRGARSGRRVRWARSRIPSLRLRMRLRLDSPRRSSSLVLLAQLRSTTQRVHSDSSSNNRNQTRSAQHHHKEPPLLRIRSAQHHHKGTQLLRTRSDRHHHKGVQRRRIRSARRHHREPQQLRTRSLHLPLPLPHLRSQMDRLRTLSPTTLRHKQHSRCKRHHQDSQLVILSPLVVAAAHRTRTTAPPATDLIRPTVTNSIPTAT